MSLILTASVDKFVITYNPATSSFTFKNGKPVNSTTLINKAKVKLALANNSLVKVRYQQRLYAVLKGDHIISLQSSTTGKEVYTGSKDGNRKTILELAKAGTVHTPLVTPTTTVRHVDRMPKRAMNRHGVLSNRGY